MSISFCLIRNSFCRRTSATNVGVSDRFEAVSSDNQLTNTVQIEHLLLQAGDRVIEVSLDILYLSIQLRKGLGLCSSHVSVSIVQLIFIRVAS